MTHQTPRMSSISENARSQKLENIISCQNWQMSSLAKISKYRQLPKLANFVSCQNWQAKFQKLKFEPTCLHLAQFSILGQVHSNGHPPWCELCNG